MTINQFLNITSLLKIKKILLVQFLQHLSSYYYYIVSTLLTFAILIRVSLFDDP